MYCDSHSTVTLDVVWQPLQSDLVSETLSSQISSGVLTVYWTHRTRNRSSWFSVRIVRDTGLDGLLYASYEGLVLMVYCTHRAGLDGLLYASYWSWWSTVRIVHRIDLDSLLYNCTRDWSWRSTVRIVRGTSLDGLLHAWSTVRIVRGTGLDDLLYASYWSWWSTVRIVLVFMIYCTHRTRDWSWWSTVRIVRGTGHDGLLYQSYTGLMIINKIIIIMKNRQCKAGRGRSTPHQ